MKKHLIIFSFLLLTLAAAAQNLASGIYAQGMRLYSAGDFAGAAEYLEQVLQMEPANDLARYYLVFSLNSSGRSKKALPHARVLAERFPGQPQYRIIVQQLEQQQFSLTQPVTAGAENIETVRQANEPTAASRPVSTPRKEKKLTDLDQAQTMIDEENYASASLILKKITDREPRSARAWHLLGVVAFNQRDYPQAVRHFDKAIDNGSREFETSFLAGSSCMSLQQYEKAEKHFNKALSLQNDIFCRLNLAEIYLRQKKYSEAENAFKTLIKNHPEIQDAAAGLAEIQYARGFNASATVAVNQVLSTRPENARARLLKARLLMEDRMYAEASEEAKIAVQANPDNPEYRAMLALAMIRNFQVPQGLEEARNIQQKHPESIDAMLTEAEGLLVSGDLAGAGRILDQAAKNGDRPEISLLQASAAVSQGDRDRARQHYEKFVELSGRSPRAMLEYARFLETSATPEEASNAYENLLKEHSGSGFSTEARAALERLATTEARPARIQTPRIPIPGLTAQ